jgi:hypothetical protein
MILGRRRVRTQGNVPESIYVRRPSRAEVLARRGPDDHRCRPAALDQPRHGHAGARPPAPRRHRAHRREPALAGPRRRGGRAAGDRDAGGPPRRRPHLARRGRPLLRHAHLHRGPPRRRRPGRGAGRDEVLLHGRPHHHRLAAARRAGALGEAARRGRQRRGQGPPGAVGRLGLPARHLEGEGDDPDPRRPAAPGAGECGPRRRIRPRRPSASPW